ncbi:MAG: VCBS repeat-containing protein, partial [Bacteroidota bacterium]
PDNSLRLSLGNKENQFERFESVEESLAVKSPDQIQTYDLDNDGILDILFADRTTDGLMFFRGKGNGKFYHRVRLADLPKESIFRCGDFNGDSAVDIAYTNPTGHTITVIYGIQK